MSQSVDRERTITRDPVNNDEVREQEVGGGVSHAPQTRAKELEFLAEYLPPLSQSSQEAILDAQRMDITPHVNEIMRKLKPLQIRCGIHTRFHLIIEKDMDDTVEKWAKASSTDVNACARIETRILVSPTLSFELGGTKTISESVADRLNAASLKALKDACSQKLNSAGAGPAPASNASTQGSPSQRTGSSPENHTELSDFDEWEHFYIPEWFPFLDEMYRTGPQVSDSEVLDIPGEYVRRFQRLPKDALEKIWSQFFRTLHVGVRRKLRKYRKLPFKYTLYTPPWLRSQIKVGTELHRVNRVTIRPVRSQRSDWGYRTMTLVLAGYFFREPDFGKPVLLHLLSILASGNEVKTRRLSDRNTLPPRPTKIRLDDNGRPILSERNHAEADVPPSGTEGTDLVSPPLASMEVINPLVNTAFVSGSPEPSTREERVKTATEGDHPLHHGETHVVNQNSSASGGETSRRQINCAAKNDCRFRDDLEAQLPSGITAKCKECKRPIHDLCGGGEQDHKYCPQCKPSKRLASCA